MNYELAKELKDAGFGNFKDDVIDDLTGRHFTHIWEPTLSKLINACGEPFMLVKQEDKLEWAAHGGKAGQACTGIGFTSEIAVAHLWLALNKKP